MDREGLNKRLSQIEDQLIRIERTNNNRIYLLCEAQNCFNINRFLFEDLGLRFIIATAIDSDKYYEILYHFSHDESGCVVTVKAYIRDRKNPSVESISQFLPGAQWIEREMHDLVGIEFRNHPDMRRLILADDWPEGVYPLRKKAKNEKGN